MQSFFCFLIMFLYGAACSGAFFGITALGKLLKLYGVKIALDIIFCVICAIVASVIMIVIYNKIAFFMCSAVILGFYTITAFGQYFKKILKFKK